jgi:acyl-CoA synthetase (NDP forming)
VPGPLDLAIILVSHNNTLPTIQKCALKGIKGAALFSDGYGETRYVEGRVLEAEVVKLAWASGIRPIGPNGMKFYGRKSGSSFFPNLARDHGSIAILFHSGSLTDILGYI